MEKADKPLWPEHKKDLAKLKKIGSNIIH